MAMIDVYTHGRLTEVELRPEVKIVAGEMQPIEGAPPVAWVRWRGEAGCSISLSLAEAKELRDLLAQAVSAAEGGTRSGLFQVQR